MWTVFWMNSVSSAAAAADRWTFTSFDVPGAVSNAALGINGDGAVVGVYLDSAAKQHGFLLSGGTFTTIDYPGAISTQASAINSHGDIVGYHTDVAGMPGGSSRAYLLRQRIFTDTHHTRHFNTLPLRITD